MREQNPYLGHIDFPISYRQLSLTEVRKTPNILRVPSRPRIWLYHSKIKSICCRAEVLTNLKSYQYSLAGARHSTYSQESILINISSTSETTRLPSIIASCIACRSISHVVFAVISRVVSAALGTLHRLLTESAS